MESFKVSVMRPVRGLVGVAALLTTLCVLPSSVHAQGLSCGPHALTYVVRSLDNRAGTGIRCVKFHPSGARGFPVFIWYGEGQWAGYTYRHVGRAAFEPDGALVGAASDIHGNGESFNNNFPGNLWIQVVSGNLSYPTEIHITGAWNEAWTLGSPTHYTPLPRPHTCGSYFMEFSVVDLTGSRPGSGLRCALSAGPTLIAWFGSGEWSGTTYAHLGIPSSVSLMKGTTGTGAASDLCGPFGQFCNEFPQGSVHFSPLYERVQDPNGRPQGWIFDGFEVTGAWHELWECQTNCP
jgi:hypothetical protein